MFATPTAASFVQFESNDAQLIAGALCSVIADVNDFQKLIILGWMIFLTSSTSRIAEV